MIKRILALILLLTLVGCETQATLAPTAAPPPATVTPTPKAATFLDKPTPQHIRIMSYNVNWDSIFPADDPDNSNLRDSDRVEPFRRILKAVRPDVVCLQEINQSRDPAQVSAILDEVLPLEDGERWRAHLGQDNAIVSRFDLEMQADASIHQNRTLTTGHALALLDLPDETYAADLYMVCAHFKSSGGEINVRLRQHQADTLVDWLRDARTPGGKIDLAEGTPWIILGDLNAYDTDPAYHVTTLVTGDIVNEDRYGVDAKPDWDGTAATDALPRHNGTGTETYTWRNDREGFNPGVLDRIIYADSVLRVDNSFVLNTTTMPPALLQATGLQANDVFLDPITNYYDHLPVVVDVSLAK